MKYRRFYDITASIAIAFAFFTLWLGDRMTAALSAGIAIGMFICHVAREYVE